MRIKKESNVILNPKSEFGNIFIRKNGEKYNIKPTNILSCSKLNFRIESIKTEAVILVSSDNDKNKDFIVKFQ
jgi:hypothetical protein